MKEGFVTIRFVSSDGTEGEVLIDADDPEALFIRLKREATRDGRICTKGQLTLDLQAEQAKLHIFS